MGRRVCFVKYWERGSTAIGADQMAPALARLGVDARSIDAASARDERDAVLVYVKRADLGDLVRARARGNRLVLDVQDTLVFRRWISHWMLYDGVIFRNRRQQADYAPRRALCRTLYQHWDPRYRPHQNGFDGLRVAYLGIPRSLAIRARPADLAMIGPERWFEEAGGFNAHLSVRTTRRELLYKPNAKVATAAACDAVLVTTRDEAARELLGDDYPFYLDGGEAPSVAAGLERVREAYGGAEWREALARLRALRAELAIERVAERYVAMLRELG
ncbi:MAG TPA: hypothetical protein VF100_01025 [Thermoanaerobaculia bacterium]